MKKITFTFLAFSIICSGYSQIFKGKQTTAHFLSKASLEDIEAKNTTPALAVNFSTGNIQVKILIKAFKFASSFMEEHFNENYMESDKYPNSIFSGKINEKVDYTKDGEYKVTCTGKLEIHGVTKEVTLPGTIKIAGTEITLTSAFKVKLVDYKIKVPSLYSQKIAEEIAVDITSVMEPLKKP